MKKLFAISLLAVSGAALADNDVGCGLGTVLWEGQAGLLPKVLAATTNGTYGNQTFGITSGTLGCSADGVIKAEARKAVFASANLDRLAADMAKGEGESLAALAALYGVSEADRAAFNGLAQAQVASLFANDSTTGADVVASLTAAMKLNANLARYTA